MEQLSFEEAFAQLEATVEALQMGKLSLNEALTSYQDGVKLAQYCHELLQAAELSVQTLQRNSQGDLFTESLEL